MVQTGPNNQLGGLNTGLFKNKYQVLIFLVVAKLPIAPTARGSKMHSVIWINFFMSHVLCRTILGKKSLRIKKRRT